MTKNEVPKGVFIAAIVVIVLIVAVIGYKVIAAKPETGPTANDMKHQMEAHHYSTSMPAGTSGRAGRPAASMGYGGPPPGGSSGQ